MNNIDEKVFSIETKDTKRKINVTIRLANNIDVDHIIKIEQTCFPPAEAATPDSIKDRFKTFSENFVVAEGKEENKKEKEIIGFINGCCTDKPELPDELYHDSSLHKKEGDYQTVFGLDVLPEYRNRGVAGELIKMLIELSKKRNKKGVVLTCKDYLIHYYEKFGFKHKGVSNSSHGGAKWNDMLLEF